MMNMSKRAKKFTNISSFTQIVGHGLTQKMQVLRRNFFNLDELNLLKECPFHLFKKQQNAKMVSLNEKSMFNLFSH